MSGSLTPAQRKRFMDAADAALRVRRNILLLAQHATGHGKVPHGETCEDCGLRWPCVTVMRAAGPALNAVADLPSMSALPSEVIGKAADRRFSDEHVGASLRAHLTQRAGRE